MKRITITLLILTGFLGGCRKEIPQINRPEDYYGSNYVGIFEMFWSGMNHNYVFWDIDTTDWDRVYRDYRPLFEALDDDTIQDYDEKHNLAKQYMNSMSAGLADGHYTIIYADGTGFRPSDARLAPRQTPVLWRQYENDFLNICNSKLNERRVFSNDDFLAVTGNIPVNGGIVPYFFWSGFSILQNISVDASGQFLDMFNEFFKDFIRRPNCKGIILDVRGNGGGNMQELGMILGSLTSEEVTIAHTKQKNGEGRLDYTPWIPLRIIPMDYASNITVPVVILTDVNSVSCSEITTMGVRNLPNGNGYQIGKATHGGNGPLTWNNYDNGGQFSTAIVFNGLSPQYNFVSLVYTSSRMLKTAFDGKCYEGIGLPPNIDVALDINEYQNGVDTQLERALQFIVNGQ